MDQDGQPHMTPQAPVRAGRWDATRIAAFGFAALWLVSIGKVFLVSAFYSFDRSVTELMFSFGAKVAAIQATGWPETCADFCAIADRMPGLPYFTAGMAAILGDDLFAIMAAKTLALDALCLTLIWRLWCVARPPLWAALALAAVWCGPQFLLHTAATDYEEGLTIQLIAALLAMQLVMAAEGAPGWRMILLYLALAGVLFLIKSSLAPFYFWALGFLALRLPRGRRLGWLALGFAPFAIWTATISIAAGELRFGSSYDGPNLYRGANDIAAMAYPEINLDRLFDTESATLPDGRLIAMPNHNVTAPRFEREWDWSDHYRGLAVGWIAENPGAWLRLALRKFWIMAGAIENTPPGDDQRGMVALAGMAWMAAMRVLLWGSLGALAWKAWRGEIPRAMAVAMFGGLAAYAAPYVAGFAYERHAVVMFLPAALALIAASPSTGHPRRPIVSIPCSTLQPKESASCWRR